MKPMTTLVGLLAAAAWMIDVVAASYKCHSYNSKDACLKSLDEKPCLWCSSAAVPSSCYEDDEAAQLPPGVFECTKETLEAPPNHGCHFYNTEASCVQNTEGDKPCFWCKSAAVPSQCYNETEAEQLPPAVFQCDMMQKALVFKADVVDLAALASPNVPVIPVDSESWWLDPVNHGCHFYNAKESCIHNTEGGKPCYWCKSAAVPSTCYNETEAKQLPPAIFQCDKEDSHAINWALVEIPSPDAFAALFSHWAATFNVEYPSVEERQRRAEVFYDNAKLVAQHNQQVHATYTLELNKFADTTWDEFKQLYLGASTPQNCSAAHTARLVAKDVPEAIDWRRWGAVSPVKDQGKCGSCWTFSSTGCLESHNLLTHGKKVLLSEQNLIDCAQAFDNHGCSGGLPSHAFEYVKYNGGLDTGASYPYHAKDEKCRFSPASVGVKVLDVVNITSRDETELRMAVGTVGPVSIAFQVASDFRFYKEGVYDSTVCQSGEEDVNHAVLAVGYNATEDGRKYWIVKNSWSAKWGLQGYFNIARDKNMCGLADCASYPLV
ncbi:hypothetical protein H310_04555 [Aphanomyces invadans]|uniref:Peptidase C1A papain C-terminal domain-containing protein n=1 Tax=Aphanomyces invadans TaxID=157072 RepID=A0A024UEY7_9STRA|nr:hypothetical protein H310_04555 [Aphanomyces invadans]ETW04213.1 hypothetical protein H310_04555 [Aphanomyces invadans]|eukprot:XP_008867169.1 hypothetical protein H310_04555 [Aphanomyces invadans]